MLTVTHLKVIFHDIKSFVDFDAFPVVDPEGEGVIKLYGYIVSNIAWLIYSVDIQGEGKKKEHDSMLDTIKKLVSPEREEWNHITLDDIPEIADSTSVKESKNAKNAQRVQITETMLKACVIPRSKPAMLKKTSDTPSASGGGSTSVIESGGTPPPAKTPDEAGGSANNDGGDIPDISSPILSPTASSDGIISNDA